MTQTKKKDRQEYLLAYKERQRQKRLRALQQTQRNCDTAAAAHVHFVITKGSNRDLWNIAVKGEQGTISDVATERLPHLVNALFLMGKRLRYIRMNLWHRYQPYIDRLQPTPRYYTPLCSVNN